MESPNLLFISRLKQLNQQTYRERPSAIQVLKTSRGGGGGVYNAL